jgi:hypothetical protein
MNLSQIAILYSTSNESYSCESDENPDSQDYETEVFSEDEDFAAYSDSDDVFMDTDSDEELSLKSNES